MRYEVTRKSKEVEGLCDPRECGYKAPGMMNKSTQMVAKCY